MSLSSAVYFKQLTACNSKSSSAPLFQLTEQHGFVNV